MSRFLTRTVTRAARCSSQRLEKASLIPAMNTFKQSNVQRIMPTHSLLQTRFFASETNPIHDKIDKLVNNAKVVVFMKGEQAAPQCGFSNAVVQILKMHDVTFESHNVLADEELRQGIKEYSNWPTIPQVYLEKEFIGGCDILLKMHQDGSLIEALGEAGIKSALVADEPGN